MEKPYFLQIFLISNSRLSKNEEPLEKPSEVLKTSEGYTEKIHPGSTSLNHPSTRGIRYKNMVLDITWQMNGSGMVQKRFKKFVKL
jgi:hypothetical protein